MRIGLRERVRYWFDGTMSRGTPALIGWLGLASLVLILVVTGSAMVLAPQDVAGHPMHVAWMSLLRTLDPGTMGSDDGSWVFLLLMLTVTVGGIFIVSALVGVLSSGLDTRLAELRKGRSVVVESGHTIILGWSEEIFTIITELAQADEGTKACAVVLADRDKVEMEDEIRARLRRSVKIKVVCRTGDPTDPLELEITRPDLASAIIIPAPAGPGPDIRVIKTILALNHRDWPPQRPPIVAVISDSSNMPAARLAGAGAVDLVDAEDMIARLVVQSRRQAGLSVVCSELLSFDGHELYLHHDAALAGLSCGEAQLALDEGVFAGLVQPDGTVTINPPPDTGIGVDDRAVVLAPTRRAIRLSRTVAPINEAAIKAPVPVRLLPERTLVLGWNRRADSVVRLLDRYVPAGSSLHVTAVDFQAQWLPAPGDLAHLTVSGSAGDPTERAVLDVLDPGSYDHVVVLSDDRVPSVDADARTLVTLLHLRDIRDHGVGRYAIVSELNEESNRQLALITRADDFVVGRRMISLFLTQLSKSPHLNAVVAELFEARGADIYLQPADQYVQPGVQATFATIIVSASRRRETAIGVRLHAESQLAPSYGIHLNPAKKAPFTLTPHDRVIVLAHRYNDVHAEAAT